MSFPHAFSGNPASLTWIPAVVYPQAGGDRNDNLGNQMKTYYIYLMASKKNGTLYLGTTNDLVRRVWQHKNNVHEGFTKKYNVHRLV